MSRVAFTLLELLCVLAVIALLAAILLPALQRSQEEAAQQACHGQLRQIEIALVCYCQENDDRFPRTSYMPSVSSAPLRTKTPIFIADILLPFVGNQAEVFHCPKDTPNWSEREPPNTGKSYFQTERSSYAWLNCNHWSFRGYEKFHSGDFCGVYYTQLWR